MAKTSQAFESWKMSQTETLEYIKLRKKENIILQEQLKGKRIIYNEDIINDDGCVDFRLYYIEKGKDIRDDSTIIYVDYYSQRKKREKNIDDFKRSRRRRAV